MPTNSEIVKDEHIQAFKDAIDQYKRLKKEAQLAIDAGLNPTITPKEIDDKIRAAQKVIETYTGQRYPV